MGNIKTTDLKLGDIIRINSDKPDYVVMNLVGTNSPDHYDVLALPHGRGFQQTLKQNRQITLAQEDMPDGVQVVGYVDLDRIKSQQPLAPAL